MDFQVDKQPGRIAISGEMTIYAAAALRDELFPFVRAAQEELQLDLSGVTALDTAGLQLLLMIKRVARLSGVDVKVAAASAAAQDVLTLCRLDAALQSAGAA